jgi:uncharacterized repeat protein (TIGR01451 family)
MKRTVAATALAGSLLLMPHALAAPSVYPFGVTIHQEGVAEGYVIFHAQDNRVHLMDVAGTDVHRWSLTGNMRAPARALADGHILVARGGQLVETDWDGTIVWSYTAPSGVAIHHDWERLPNGNTLILCRETAYDPAISVTDVDDDFIVEVTPGGSIVWEWHLIDHIAELGLSQERLDLIYVRGGDIGHTNSISAIPDGTSHSDPRFSPGNVIISLRNQNTVAIIDRGTGEIVWALTDSTIGQHTAFMLSDDLPGGGNIMVFDNGWAHNWSIVPNQYYSRVLEIDPVTMSFPYSYTAESSGYPLETFFSHFQSGAQRLANGNTLIVESRWGRMFEVTDNGQIVWEYISPYFDNEGLDHRFYRAYKVPLEWAGPHFEPDLVVSMDGDPDPVQVGHDLGYTISVENVGDDPAVGVELAGATPTGTTFQSLTAPTGWDCSVPAVGGIGPVTCGASNLGAGAAAILTLVVRVGLCDIDGTVISNTATVSSLGNDADPGNNAAMVDAVADSDLAIPDLAVRLIGGGEDTRLEWGDGAPACGYHVLRSPAPDGGFADTSGLLFDNFYEDSGAGSSPEDYYYLVRID